MAGGCVHNDDQLWDTGGQREVDDATKVDVMVRHQEVVDGRDQPDDRPWDTGGGGEPPHDEVNVSGVQVPPPKDKGEHREQKYDVQISVLMGGGGAAKSRLSNHLQNMLSRWYRTGSDLLPCELPAAHSDPRHAH